MIANASAIDGGIVHVATGSFTSDGTAIVVNLGFNPARFELQNMTDVTTWEKFAAMPAANSLKTVTAGTFTLDTTSAVLFNGDGTVTISASAVPTGKSCVFYAVA